MKAILLAVFSAILVMGLTMQTAEAKRLGGGSSFGSKSSHSQPQKSDAAPDAKPQGAPQAAPASSSAAAPAATPPRPGFGGMMGGMLGGLLMGGLLGSLFAGGAFDGINFMDILVFAALGLAAFMAFRYFAARRAPKFATASSYGAPAPADVGASSVPEAAYQRSAVSMPGSSSSFDAFGSFGRKLALPAGFITNDFLDGAKRSYTLLQTAWDKGDLADVREFTTDKVFAEIQDQFRARSGENRTEIQSLNAELMDVKEVNGNLEASVMFDSKVSEYDANSPMIVDSSHVREIWHFVRPKLSLRPTWFLDGIQQVER